MRISKVSRRDKEMEYIIEKTMDRTKRTGRIKTKRQKQLRIRILSVLIVVIILVIGAGILYKWNIIPHKRYTNGDFGIEKYKSDVDKDGDGIDDQTDILEGVRKYIATEPQYKSVYYAGGYPDDEYGVCTDVVAQGFLNAGYDLMELVSEDIANAPEAYNIDIPDKNIDFRRVRNLKVFFKRHAISLTTDVSKIEQWQGGDIVIFESHIGIISDKRNSNGTVFIIHHGSPTQAGYEQDIFEGRDDIIGHFRWN